MFSWLAHIKAATLQRAIMVHRSRIETASHATSCPAASARYRSLARSQPPAPASAILGHGSGDILRRPAMRSGVCFADARPSGFGSSAWAPPKGPRSEFGSRASGYLLTAFRLEFQFARNPAVAARRVPLVIARKSDGLFALAKSNSRVVTTRRG